MKTIQLYKNRNELSNLFTIIDDDIYEQLKHEKLYLAEFKDNEGQVIRRYVEFCSKNRTGIAKYTYLHRFIMKHSGYVIDKKEIDHINGNGLDNRIKNMRVSDKSQNCSNRPANNGHKHKNVYEQKNSKGESVYQVIIMRNRKYYSWFSTKSLLEAIIFANMKRKELFGEYSHVEYIEGFSDEDILKTTEVVLKKIELIEQKKLEKMQKKLNKNGKN